MPRTAIKQTGTDEPNGYRSYKSGHADRKLDKLPSRWHLSGQTYLEKYRLRWDTVLFILSAEVSGIVFPAPTRPRFCLKMQNGAPISLVYAYRHRPSWRKVKLAPDCCNTLTSASRVPSDLPAGQAQQLGKLTCARLSRRSGGCSSGSRRRG